MPKRLHNAGVSNVRFLSTLFWSAYERQHWSLLCAVLELLCAFILRQKPGLEVPHTRLALQGSQRAAGDGPAGVFNWEGNHQIISMLQHVVNMRHRGQHDISQLIISGLQSLVVSPSVQAVLSFAQSHLAVSTDPRESAHSYGFRAQQDLNFSNLSRQRTSYSVERSRATVLAALDNVYTALRGIQGEPAWHFASTAYTTPPVRVAICTGTGSWGLLGKSSTANSSSWLPSSYSDFQFLWEDSVRMLEEECKEPDSFEARLLLLHLEAISGRALVPQVAHAQSLQHVDSAKLAAISGLIPSIGGFKFDTGRRQSTGRKRKRSVSKKRVEPSQDSHSMRPSLQADDLFQADHSSCATLQEVLQSGCLTPHRFRCLLLHLDNAVLSCCVGGTACISSVLAHAARCLHIQCMACKTCIQQLQGQPSTSAGLGKPSSDDNSHSAFVTWIEMVLSVRERSWWTLAGNPAHDRLLVQSRSLACRLLGGQMTARDVLNAACIWAVMEVDSGTFLDVDVGAGVQEVGLDVCRCDAEILMLQNIADCSRMVGPLV